MLTFRLINDRGEERTIETISELSEMIEEGTISPSTLFWDEMRKRWVPASEIEEYRRIQQIIEDAKVRGHGIILRTSTPIVSSEPQRESQQPVEKQQSRLPVEGQQPVSEGTHPNPRYLIHKAQIATRLLPIGLLVLLSAIGWHVYMLEQVRVLLNQYGYGHVPAGLMPSGLEASDSIFWIVSIAWYMAIIWCTMYCFRQIFRILKTHFKKTMRYSFGWTVGSIFIPVMCLIRPWLGLAEIRKKVGALRFGIERKFDGYTLFFGLAFCFNIISLRLISIQMEALTKQTVDQSYFATAVNLEMAYAVIAIVVSLIAFLYSRSIIVAARDAISLPLVNPVTVVPPVSAAMPVVTPPAAAESSVRYAGPSIFDEPRAEEQGWTATVPAENCSEQPYQRTVQTKHPTGAAVVLIAIVCIVLILLVGIIGWVNQPRRAVSDADIGVTSGPSSSNGPVDQSSNLKRAEIRASLNTQTQVNGCISKQNSAANSAATIERYCTCFVRRLSDVITGEEFGKLNLAAAVNMAPENLPADFAALLRLLANFVSESCLARAHRRLHGRPDRVLVLRPIQTI